MRFLVVFKCFLLFYCAPKQSLCSSQNERSDTLTFSKQGVNLPGPTMSFNLSLTSGVFYFEFKTFVDRALLLYEDDNGNLDYISLVIDEGFIDFSYALGKTIWDLSSKPHRVDDYQWHTVRIGRNLSYLSFVLDGKELHAKKIEEARVSWSYLQLGGFPTNRVSKSSSITYSKAINIYIQPRDWRGFFLGCVRNIKYGKDEDTMMPVEDIHDLRLFVGQGGCNLTLCDKRRRDKPPGICEHGGVCSPHGENSAKCDCTWTGFGGSTCTKDALRLILNGTYKVVYKLSARILVQTEQFTLRIKTILQHTILFVANEASTNKLVMKIEDSRFVVALKTDRGVNVISLNLTISDGTWHKIRYRRDGNFLSLSVDDTAKNTTLRNSTQMMIMGYDSHLYIGDNTSNHGATIAIEDFVWQYFVNGIEKEINFVKGFYESFASSSHEYSIVPSNIVPDFNRKLPEQIDGMIIASTTASAVLDDCTEANKSCHLNADCSEREHSPVCVCKSGFSGDGIVNCTDIDECKRSRCHEHATCSNTYGSYVCTCALGFDGDGYFNCSDVNECSNVPCVGQCENTFGSFSCYCGSGFTGDGIENCTDIDECAESENKCDENEKCRNTEGSYFCAKVCGKGFIEDKYNSCIANVPDNPCDSVPCFPGLECYETPDGSSTCEECPVFFVGNGNKCSLNETEHFVPAKIELVLTSEKWTVQLTDKFSKAYRTLATKIIKQIRKIYANHSKFAYAIVKEFRKGSVVGKFTLLFTEKTNEPLKPLQKAIDDGGFTTITVEMREPVSATISGSKKTKILGLHQTIFFCLVAMAAGLSILMMIIFALVMRRKKQCQANIGKKSPEDKTNTTETQGLHYKNAEGNGGSP